jgi:hypothetical protein
VLGLQRRSRRRAAGHVEHRRGQRIPIAVEDVRRGRQTQRGDKLPPLVEDRRGDAAEVRLELLPVDPEAGFSDVLQLVGQRPGRGDRMRREGLQARWM